MMTLNHAQEWGLKIIREAQVEHVIGVDEVGLGACAGPLVVCAAVFKKGWSHPEVKDSKAYNGQDGRDKHQKRLRALKDHIRPAILFQELEVVGHKDIDALGLGIAVEDAMRRVALKCSHAYPDSVVAIDGDNKPYLQRARVVVAIPKGDSLVPAISAASVIAKTTRDAMMITLEDLYPGYGFEDHMGYWTDRHARAVEALGVCPIHRLSYKNIQTALARRAAVVRW